MANGHLRFRMSPFVPPSKLSGKRALAGRTCLAQIEMDARAWGLACQAWKGRATVTLAVRHLSRTNRGRACRCLLGICVDFQFSLCFLLTYFLSFPLYILALYHPSSPSHSVQCRYSIFLSSIHDILTLGSMGLFVAGDGHYQGWLAAFLCCCAAVDVDEHPVEKSKANGTWVCSLVPAKVNHSLINSQLPLTSRSAMSNHCRLPLCRRCLRLGQYMLLSRATSLSYTTIP